MARNFECSPGACAKVSIIDTALLCNIPVAPYLHPLVPGFDHLVLPAYAFLVESSRGERILFDLGTRKDWDQLAPAAKAEIDDDGIDIKMEDDVLDVLQKNGVEAADIDAIVLSHHHFDHIGDPSLFPPETKLVVGPGFLNAFKLGYPTNPESPILDSMYKGRTVVEVSFNDAFKLGKYQAVDYFNDGSFYLLNAPGHSIGHMCALARTTSAGEQDGSGASDTFIFMGADACHHAGEFRPSPHRELPDQVSPSPFSSNPALQCPGHGFRQYLIDNRGDPRTPFFEIPSHPQYAQYVHDIDAAKETICSLQDFDACDNVFVVLAHDKSLQGRIDFFPNSANDWAEKQWGNLLRWSFLEEFPAIA